MQRNRLQINDNNKATAKLFVVLTVSCILLQVVDNILYSGSADMKVQAHNLNVSLKHARDN